MKAALLIFFGGGLGSLSRYFVGKYVSSFHTIQFPLGTLTANALACLIMGMVAGILDSKMETSTLSRAFWMVGFCGGFSTFSAFSHEALSLYQQQASLSSLLYILLSVVVCILFTVGGICIGQRF
ncbi:MAG: fluoride efflux transporter CrcB [Flammeovirgaceae bacterium]|nr:fluoride efflux transporter CrcB [Flammeovirgaceae bacterium]